MLLRSCRVAFSLLFFSLNFIFIVAELKSPSVDKDDRFVPQVAFNCGYRNRYLDKEGNWVSDQEKFATCMKGKLDILKYCRKVYPDLDVTNIVETGHFHQIDDWCKEEGTPCKWTHIVKPYRCIVGNFESDALLVPEGCRFGHVDDRQKCDDFPHWQKVAQDQCDKRPSSNRVHSFAMLEPCGLDMFSGVEFVCCPPKDQAHKPAVIEHISAKIEKEDSEDESEEYEQDAYDQDEDDDDEDTESYDSDEDQEKQDPYFSMADPEHEHQLYKEATHRLEEGHKAKSAKVMREWSELESRYKEMKMKDPNRAQGFKTEMDARFQRTIKALEEEHQEERRQLDDVHQERIAANLNERKRDTLKEYREALANNVAKPSAHKVLKTLQAYIRSEEKDRTHSLNRYRHLLKSDPDRAADIRSTVLRRLREMDLRINSTIAMLHDMPNTEKKIKPSILDFWKNYRIENTPDLWDDRLKNIGVEYSRILDAYKEQFELEKNVEPLTIDSSKEKENELKEEEQIDWEEEEPQELTHALHEEPEYHVPAHMQQDAHVYRARVSDLRSPSKSTGHGVFVMSLAGTALLMAIVFGVIVVRRRSSRGQGFIQVDQCSPEEKHVSSMQCAGYENPTYSYFEKA